MSNIIKRIMIIVLGIALLIYTIVQYTAGKSDLTFLVITIALVAYVVVSMIGRLIRDLKNR